jgi:uncharacterized protein YejL (UPF0352 family)
MSTIDDREYDDKFYCASDSSLDDNTPKEMDESITDDGNRVIAAKETREVRQVKCVVLLVVFMSVLGCLAVFSYSKRLEQSQFEKSFYSDGNKVLESLQSSIERSLVALDNLAMNIITVSRVSNQSFPFVAVPDFGKHVATVAPIVGSHTTSYAPLVRLSERREWENFASEKNTAVPLFVKETIAFQETYPFYYGPKVETYRWQYRDSIHREDYENPPFSDLQYYNSTRPGLLDIYLPILQRFPLVMTYYSPANWGKFSCLK